MLQRIVVLSGPICAGKSRAAKGLAEHYAVPIVRTRALLEAYAGTTDRRALQRAGAELDDSTNGAWIADALARWEGQQAVAPDRVVIDSVRDARQIAALRANWPHAVVHVHIDAAAATCRARYEARGESTTVAVAFADPVEAQVAGLAALADSCLNTDRHSPTDVIAIAAGIARLIAEHQEALVDVLVGGQWGSEGKGQIAAYLAPEYSVLIRVGGPNAGHSVFEEDGPDKFYHLPSGSNRNPKATLVLGPGAVIYPPVLLEEIQTHAIEIDRLKIDPRAMVIDDWDRAAESELRATIGSTAQGVGLATARKLLRKVELRPGAPLVRLAEDEPSLASYIRPTRSVLADAYQRRKRIQLEGTQGTLLSIHHGSYPHVTSRDTTVCGCLAEAGIPPGRVRRSIMVCRTYPIRVANSYETGLTSGPMGIEIDWGVVSERSGIPRDVLESRELSTTTKRLRRVSEFSWTDLASAAALNSPTDIALTFVDYFGSSNAQANRFEQLNPEAREFVDRMERVGGAPVSMLAVDFSHRAIIDRRRW